MGVPATVCVTVCTVLTSALTACGGGEPADPAPTGLAPEPSAPEATSAGGTGGWTAGAELPQARTENSVVALDGLVYVAGGFGSGGGELPTQLFIYDPATDTWREGAPVPAGRHHAALAAHDGTVYLVGGFSGGSGQARVPQRTLFEYDVATDTWREGPPMPEARGAHAAAATAAGRIHVVGGVDDGARAEQFVFDPVTGDWSSLPAMPTPREHLGAAYLDGTIYVAAGRASGASDLTAFEAYDVET